MRIIAVCNLKGGVAKTVTTVNLAAILARDLGRRVLVIDADSQANSTAFLGAAVSDGEETLASILRTPKAERTRFSVSFLLEQAIRFSSVEGVDILPADTSLMDLDLSKAEDERAWTQALALGLPDLAWRYDYCLIDCPPAFNAASAAALLAAGEVLIPIKLDAFALEGMANLMAQIANMRRINPALRVLGLLPVMWYRSEPVERAEKELRLAGLPMLPRIRRSDKVDEMTFRQEPLTVFSPHCAAATDYRRLARKIDRRGGEDAASCGKEGTGNA